MVKKVNCLFPSLKDNITSEKRIAMYLAPEDHEWANNFCGIISSDSNYINLKKILGKIHVEALKNHHEIILNFIEKNSSDLNLISSFVSDLNYLYQQSRSISSSIVNLRVDHINNSSDILECERIFDTINFFLKQDNSPLLIEANRRYDIIFEKLSKTEISDEIVLVYEKEKENLIKYLNRNFKDSYTHFLLKKNAFCESERRRVRSYEKTKYYKNNSLCT